MAKMICLMAVAMLVLVSVVSGAWALEPIKLPPPTLTPTLPGPPKIPDIMAQAEGVVKKGGTTSYMYGTHVLAGVKTYALKSSTINLDNYVGRKVRVTGKLIAGYPISGGPEYMDVTSISE